MKNEVYLILFDWSTNDSDGIEMFLYSRFEDALEKLNEIIENECNPDVSWVGSEVFDENSDVNEGYELDCNTDDKNAKELYWHVVDKNDYNRRSFINLFKNAVKMYAVTNTYDLAVWHVRWYQREPPDDSETKLPILNAKWLIIPVKTYHEYRRLWRDCPFDP